MADSILYHYPRTQRLGRDASEIEATKNAATMHLPVFVITPGSRETLRTVVRGEVAGWDDDLEVFRVRFVDGPLEARPSLPRLARPAARRAALGVPYRRADEEAAVASRDPFTIDPDKIDRGLVGHARTQNVSDGFFRRASVDALAVAPSDPNVTTTRAWARPASAAACLTATASTARPTPGPPGRT